MKILFFASDFTIGLSALLTEQASYFNGLPGTEFIFVAGEREQVAGLGQKFNDIKAPLYRIRGLDDHREFTRLIQDLKVIVATARPDVIHVQNNWQLALMIFLKYTSFYKFKIIYTVHGFRHNHKLKSYIARSVIGVLLKLYATKVIVASGYVKNVFSFLGEKVSLLFLGVEDSFFKESSFDGQAGVLNMIFAGQFREGKNQDILVRALDTYFKRTGDKNIFLYLPGEGELRLTVENLVRELGLQENVIFPGQLDRKEILELYKQCQIALVPSNSETFGHCIAEPFVLGRCVISRNVGVAQDVISHGETGFIFEDEHDLAELLQNILQDREIITHISHNAFLKRDIFNWDMISKQYLQLLNTAF